MYERSFPPVDHMILAGLGSDLIRQLFQGIEMAIPVDDFRTMRPPTGKDQDIRIRNRFPRLTGPDGDIHRLLPATPVSCEQSKNGSTQCFMLFLL